MITMARQLSEGLASELAGTECSNTDKPLRKFKSFKRVLIIGDTPKQLQPTPPVREQFEKLTSENIKQAWVKFYNTRSPSLRHRIIEYYLPIAEKAGNRYKALLPYRPLVEGGDLINDATVGLLQAVDDYNPYIGTPFEVYSKMRLYGAIVDSLREMQPFSRSISKLKRDVRNLTAAYVEKFGHEPTDVEFVAEYGIEYQAILLNPLLRSNVYNQGLNHHYDSNSYSSSSNTYEEFESKYLAVDGCEEACNKQMDEDEIFEICNKHLPTEMHRDAVTFYYRSDMTLKDIGKALVVFDKNRKPLCPSSVSKLLSISLVMLRQVPGLKELLQPLSHR